MIPSNISFGTPISFTMRATNYDMKLKREGLPMNEWLELCKSIHPSHKETAVLSLNFAVGDIFEDETSPLVSIEYYADNPCQQADDLTTNCMENMWWVKIIAKDEGTGLNSFAFRNIRFDCGNKTNDDSNINLANTNRQISNNNVAMNHNNENK